MRIEPKEYLYKKIIESDMNIPNYLSYLLTLSYQYFEDYPEIIKKINKEFLYFRLKFYNQNAIPSLENIEIQIKNMEISGKKYLVIKNEYGLYKYSIVDLMKWLAELRNFIIFQLKEVPIRFTQLSQGGSRTI